MLRAHKAPDMPEPGNTGFGPHVALVSVLFHAAVVLLAGLIPALPTPPVPDVPMVVELVFEDDAAVTAAAGPVTPDRAALADDAAEETPPPLPPENEVLQAEPQSDPVPVPDATVFDDRLPESALGMLSIRPKPKPPLPGKIMVGQPRPGQVEKLGEPEPARRLASLEGLRPHHAPQKPNAGQSGGGRNSAVAMTGNPQPVYPRRAVRQSIEGTVYLAVTVAANGRPVQIDIAQSSGHDILDRAAVEAVYRWRFRPAMSGGRPVDGRVNLPIVFRLLR